MTQQKIVKERLEYYLDLGLTDKMKIYGRVVTDLNVPRPTVRRVARDLRLEYMQRIQILQNSLDRNKK